MKARPDMTLTVDVGSTRMTVRSLDSADGTIVTRLTLTDDTGIPDRDWFTIAQYHVVSTLGVTVPELCSDVRVWRQ